MSSFNCQTSSSSTSSSFKRSYSTVLDGEEMPQMPPQKRPRQNYNQQVPDPAALVKPFLSRNFHFPCPSTTFEELQRPQHASFTAIEREAAIMRGNSLSYALVPTTTRNTSRHRSYLEKDDHVCIQDPNEFHDNVLIIPLADALP